MADNPFTGTLSVTGNVGIGAEPLPDTQLYIFSRSEVSQTRIENSAGNVLRLAVDKISASIGTDMGTTLPFSLQTNGTPRITIDSAGDVAMTGLLTVQNNLSVTGNVGIGTTASNHKLAIAAGDINIDDSRALRQAGRWVIGGNSNVLSIGSSNAPDGRDIRLDPGFSGALTVKKDTGNVGIGTTNPVTKLEVKGDLTVDKGGNACLFTGTGNSELNRYLELLNSPNFNSASGLKVGGILVSDSYAYANPSKNDLIVKGNVGIGTASPAARLHIHSNDNDALKITNTALSKTARMGVDALGVWIEPSEMNSSIRLNANPSLGGLYIRGTDGNVGIGTSETSQKLTVASGHVQIDFGRVFGSNPNDKFIYDGKEMGNYSLGWFSDSWDFGASTAWLSGYLGIKLFTRGELRFWVDGVGNVRYAKSLERSSSRKLKESIAALPAQEAIDALEGLNPVKYNLKADKEKNLHIGFIAEDVPDLVASCDRKAVSTDNIVAVLTKVVKEQQMTISALAEKVKALENQK